MSTIDELATRLWDGHMAAAPLWASTLGDHRFCDALPDLGAEAEAARRDALGAIATAAAALDPAPLSEEERITLAVVREEAEAEGAHLASAPREIEVGAALVGPQVQLYELCPALTLPGRREAEGLVTRYRATDRWFAQAARRLDEGLARGRTPPARSARAAVRQIDGMLARPLDDDPLLAPAAPTGMGASDAAVWRTSLRSAVRGTVRPSLRAYRDHLDDVVAPRGRPDERCGLAWLPGGGEAYAAAIRRFTSLPLDPDELHAMGREEVARLDDEYAELGSRTLGTGRVEEIFPRLREDPALRFPTAAEVRGTAQAALDRANAAIGGWFARLPRAACVVVEMAAHEVADGTIAYYMPPAEDGTRPGAYHVNTYRPETRTRFEAEALAFHEAVPGHHLQIAIAQELHDLPALRRHLPMNAYVEGWALYTERLADEMGLYSGDLARLGMLSFDSWRACRLVIDTGLHHLGWTRQQAIDYLLAHSPQAESNVVNEVDRYIAWPGQALGYKVGQRTIGGLRAHAQERLGTAFDIRAFHDAVLAHGAVPLGVLDDVVRRWVEVQRG